MIAKISIVTTANQRSTFIQDSQSAFDDLCGSLQRYQQLFKKKSIVIASSLGTQVFHPRCISRVEIESPADIRNFMPATFDATIAALKPGQASPQTVIEEDYFSGQVDFFFVGGDQLMTWIQEARPVHPVDRIAGFNQIFDQGTVPYISAGGGVGFMNAENLVRLHVHAPTKYQPKDSWQAEPS